MLKSIIKVFLVLITLFCFKLNFNAYEFINPDNEERVNDAIKNIYEEKELYDELSGITDNDELDYISSDMYWWPIGSDEVLEVNGKLFAPNEPRTVRVGNGYGCGGENSWRTTGCHRGVDISDGTKAGIVNIIASKDGVVVYPTASYQTQYPDTGYYGNPDGGGLGNHIIIQHSDGLYSVYGHLAQNSITVMAGDTVQQGQVIAKMGHSGSSTGAHLHYSIRVGGTASIYSVDPMEYIDPLNPRPQGTNSSFSLNSTILSKEEFVSKMNNYCNRSGNKGFCDNFAANAGDIYDVSIKNRANPELVVVEAGVQTSWTLSSNCKYTNNYWGIGINDGDSCNSGDKYSSVLDGVIAFAKTIANHSLGGSKTREITSVYNERTNAGCDSAGHGVVGTIAGMQSVYLPLSQYRYNPGDDTIGGCYHLNKVYGSDTYCNTVKTCVTYEDINNNTCPIESKTTVCEQNDYTAWQLKKKFQIRYNIFGL